MGAHLALARRAPFGGLSPYRDPPARQAPASAEQIDLDPRLGPQGAAFAVLRDVVADQLLTSFLAEECWSLRLGLLGAEQLLDLEQQRVRDGEVDVFRLPLSRLAHEFAEVSQVGDVVAPAAGRIERDEDGFVFHCPPFWLKIGVK